MNFVIPMAGAGNRFKKAGYETPKYLIRIKGKTILQYSLESLPLEIADQIIFIVLKEHRVTFPIDSILHDILEPKIFKIIEIPTITRGQAETVLCASDIINNNEDLLIYNIDTYFKSKTLKDVLLSKKDKYDGILGCFKGIGNKWSYAKIDKDNFVTETTEKIQISEHALTGLYHFTKGADFVRAAKRNIDKGVKYENEFYIAPMYNDLILEKKKFILDYATEFIPLGTPEDVVNYQKL